MDQYSIKKRKIEKLEVPSMFLGEGRSVRIFLPPGLDDEQRYPVIYCQDGEQFFNYGRIATLATQLISEGVVQPFIIVGIDNIPEKRTMEYAPEGDRFLEYTAFFAEEMMPYIEQSYPIRSERNLRILAGDSLGGTVSLHLALDYPHLFCNVMSLSGAFLSSSLERIRIERDLRWLQLYMLIGTEETAVETERGVFDFLQANREAYRMLSERSAQITYEEKPGEHIWGFWQQHLAHALQHFSHSTLGK